MSADASVDKKVLLEIVKELSQSVREYLSSHKNYGTIIARKQWDETRKIDVVVENLFEHSLSRREISARIISEEFGDRIFGSSPSGTFILDPIDGSTNLSHNIPFFCTSLAYSSKIKDVTFDDVETAAVAWIVENKVYHAVKDGGAYADGERLHSRGRKNEPKPVYSIYTYGVPYVLKEMTDIQKRAIIRTLGSVALELCFVADGKIDALIDLSLIHI